MQRRRAAALRATVRPRVGVPILFCACLVMCAGCESSEPGGADYHRAMRLQQTGGDSAEIRDCLDRAVAAAPENIRYRRERGIFYFGNEELDRAVAELALAARDGNSYTTYLKGLAQGRGGNYRLAAATFDEAIQADPGMAQYYFGRALAASALGEHAAALRAIERAKDLEPNAQHWQYIHGVLFVRAGRTEEAATQFGKAVVYSLATRSGGIEDIHADGAREVRRWTSATENKFRALWHFARYLPGDVYDDYEPF